MRCTYSKILPLGIVSLVSVAPVTSGNTDTSISNSSQSLQYYADWPKIESAIPKQPHIERKIQRIVSQMTLGEKVGQMIMPEFKQVTPQEAKQYKIGAVLNGGGSWPNNKKYSSAEEWAHKADEYWLALDEAYAGRGFKIPFMWATDAVHGHNNVYGATVFPHNIGLGAANSPKLIKKIGEITALEVSATGLDVTFAPTVAVPRDYRWGRVYEGYSEHPEIITRYAGEIIKGIQGDELGLESQQHVLATVKHWVGDGGTHKGVDRGINLYSEDHLRNTHAMGYFSALEAGAQLVMTSFNSWESASSLLNGESSDRKKYGKLHGSQYLVSDVLKDKMGFDGIVVTDWNGHGEIKGCTNSDCPQAVNAGNDLFMVTDNKDWKAFYHNVIKQVEQGIIPQSRIDDAVTRILRVKMRAGLWEKPRPSYRQLSGEQQVLGNVSHREVARQAVRESLVLLKNENDVLPLRLSQSAFLVVGSGANSLQKQTGGWTLSWQGTENKRKDYKYASTTREAVIDLVGKKRVYTNINSAPMDAVAIVVIGEDPYAEMFGDIKAHQTLAYSELKKSYAKDLALLKKLKAQGHKVVTVFFSGRPMYVNPELALSDAFVAAWLPGTEGGGIVDVLFNQNGADFTGRLSFSWPNKKCMSTINHPSSHIPAYKVPEFEQKVDKESTLFPYGYGLDYKTNSEPLILTMDEREWGCGESAIQDKPTNAFEIYSRNSTDMFVPKMSGKISNWKATFLSREKQVELGNAFGAPLNYKHQQDALNVDLGDQFPMQFYVQTPDKKGVDMRHYLAANSHIQFDIMVNGAIPDSLRIASHCVYPCGAIAPFSKVLQDDVKLNQWTSFNIPMKCLAEKGVDYANVNTPLLIYSDEAFTFSIGEIRYVPEGMPVKGKTLDCSLFNPIAP